MRRVFLVAALLTAFSTAPSAGAQETGRFVGRPLVEALETLRARGLSLVYSSDLVPETLRVTREPEGRDPRAILDELLAPHGLEARDGPNGRILVVRRNAPRATGEIRGHLLDTTDNRRLAGVRVTSAGRSTVTGEDGSFAIEGLSPGPHEVQAEAPGFARARARTAVEPGRVARLELTLVPLPIPLAEIVVAPGRYTLLGEESAPSVVLSRRAVERLPHLSDDVFRAVHRLPGTASSDFNASFHVRGGSAEELLVVVDGLELYEPFHLKDFQNVFSIVDSRAIGAIELLTAAFPVEYGDRMSGVLDIETARPSGPTDAALGVSFINAHAATEGRFGKEDAGEWLMVARRGYLDLVLELMGEDDDFDPRYYDVVGKLGYHWNKRVETSGHVLVARDEVRFEDGPELAFATYDNAYAWANVRLDWTTALASETVVAIGSIDRHRRGFDEVTSMARDRRGYDLLGLRQAWTLSTSRRNLLKWGFDAKWLSADYDYARQTAADEPGLVFLESPLPPGIEVVAPGEDVDLAIRRAVHGATYAGWIADRVHLAPVALELGLRWDRQTYLGDDQLSPRLNLAVELGPGSSLRGGWGRFHQSQRISELQVEDGVEDFRSAQRADHWSISLEHRMELGLVVRLEGYWKQIREPQTRFENVFDPLELFPEGKGDRIRLDPTESESRGVEVLARYDGPGPMTGWASYALSKTEDRFDEVDIPRRWDQPHAFNWSLNLGSGGGWNANLAGVHRSGWPTTAVSATVVELPSGPAAVPAVGAFSGDRSRPYHRVDLRVFRSVRLGRGSLAFYFELLNLFDRDNPCCVDGFEFRGRPGGGIDVLREEDGFIPRIPSFGMTWRLAAPTP